MENRTYQSIKEIRRRNLVKIVTEEGGNGAFLNKYAHLYNPEKPLSSSMLSQLMTGTAPIGDSVSSKIERMTGKPENWMDSAHFFDANLEEPDKTLIRIPVISYVQAGLLTEVSDPYSVGSASEWINTHLTLSGNAFALRIKGNSMTPDFQEGDIVIIDPNISPTPGDFVVAKNSEEEATFKKYRQRGIDSAGNPIFELIPLNDDYPVMRSDEMQLKIIGVMMEHRTFRKR